MKKGFKNGVILTCDNQMTSYNKGFVVIENDVIVHVGDMIDFDEALAQTWIDLDGDILMPGFVNTHTHVGMVPFRSLGDDMFDRLRRFLFPLEQDVVDEQLIYHSAKYAIAEMLLAGITTFADMYYYEGTIAKATKEMKARALLGETIIDMSTPDSADTHEAFIYTQQFVEKWKDDVFVKPMIAPHGTNTNTEDAHEKIVAFAKKHKVPVMMHVCEMPYEIDYYKEKYNQTPVQYLESKGYFEQPFILVHGIFMTQEDVELVAQYPHVTIAHCIGANTKSAKGVAPIKALRDKGVIVGLGTDGPSSGNTLDLFTQMRMVANAHKTYLQDRTAFPAVDIVKMATTDGAKVLGLSEQVGSVEVGKKADMIVVETKSVNMFPIHDPYSVLVYSAYANNVKDVFVAGNQLVKDKQLIIENIMTLRDNLEKAMVSFTKMAKEQALKENL